MRSERFRHESRPTEHRIRCWTQVYRTKDLLWREFQHRALPPRAAKLGNRHAPNKQMQNKEDLLQARSGRNED